MFDDALSNFTYTKNTLPLTVMKVLYLEEKEKERKKSIFYFTIV